MAIAAHAGVHAATQKMNAKKIAGKGDVSPSMRHIQFRRSASKGVEAIENPTRRKVAVFCKSPKLELVLGLVICCSMAIIILETDATANGERSPNWMRVLNWIFLCIYLIEAGVKIYAFRWKYFKDYWNLMDFTVVILDAVLTITGLFEVSGSGVSMLRIFRMGKMARIFRVLRQIWELKMLLMSFAAAAKSIMFGMGMVLIMTTIWSVLAVQLLHPINKEIWEGRTDECERCSRAFASVWDSEITIFQTVIAGDGWGVLAVPIVEKAWWASGYFLCVLVSVQLAMLNLILAVIVERAASAKELDLHQQALAKEEEMVAAKESLLELCQKMDSDMSGSLDLNEIKAGFETNPKFASSLVSMGVFLEDVDLLFEVLDVEGTGAVSYVDLVDTLARLKSQISYVILFQLTAIQKNIRLLKHKNGMDSQTTQDFQVPRGKLDLDMEGFQHVPSKTNNEVGQEPPEGNSPGPPGQDDPASANFRRLVDFKFKEMMRETNHRFDQIMHQMSRSFDQAQRIAEKTDSSPKPERPTNLLEALAQECVPEAMRLLREDSVTGLNDTAKAGDTTLIRAIKNQMWEVAFEILRHAEFTELNATDSLGLSAWHHALVRERSDVVAAITNRPDFAAVHSLDLAAVAQHIASARTSVRAAPVVNI